MATEKKTSQKTDNRDPTSRQSSNNGVGHQGFVRVSDNPRGGKSSTGAKVTTSGSGTKKSGLKETDAEFLSRNAERIATEQAANNQLYNWSPDGFAAAQVAGRTGYGFRPDGWMTIMGANYGSQMMGYDPHGDPIIRDVMGISPSRGLASVGTALLGGGALGALLSTGGQYLADEAGVFPDDWIVMEGDTSRAGRDPTTQQSSNWLESQRDRDRKESDSDGNGTTTPPATPVTPGVPQDPAGMFRFMPMPEFQMLDPNFGNTTMRYIFPSLPEGFLQSPQKDNK